AGLLPRLVAEGPEEIGPDRTLDRAAGVLRDDQALERPAAQRFGGGDEHGGAERHVARVDRDAAAGAERHAERADRPPVRTRQLAEEDIARIGVEQLAQALRIALGPGADALHRGLVEAEFTL